MILAKGIQQILSSSIKEAKWLWNINIFPVTWEGDQVILYSRKKRKKSIPVEPHADLWEMIFLKGEVTVSGEQYEAEWYAVSNTN